MTKMDILFSFILLLNILLLVKDSQDYTFITAHKEELIHVMELGTVQFSGTIKLLSLDIIFDQTNLLSKTDVMILYTFSSEYIEENGTEYINYENYYELEEGDEIEIESYENYLLFLGNGYVSFGEINYHPLYLDIIKDITLPYNLNNKYYQLSGKGNTLEILSSWTQIIVYINGRFCNWDSCVAQDKDIINVVNWLNGKNQNVKLLFVDRKDIYSVDLEKGDKVKYLFNQNFKFEIENSLAQSYFDLDEGILAVYGKPNLSFSSVLYSHIEDYSTYQLYYINPYSNSITIDAQTNTLLSKEITIEGLNPTISITFPETCNLTITKGFGPQYLRININSTFEDDFMLDFGTTVNWFEGKMFTDQGSLNKGENKSSVNISKEDAGKTYTAIYNNNGIFKATKIINWIELKEYEYKKFEISEGEEKAFKFTKSETSSKLIKFENGYSGDNITIYVYNGEDSINYDAIKRQYIDYLEIRIELPTQLEYNYGKICLIMKANEYYSDYISIRSKDKIKH